MTKSAVPATVPVSAPVTVPMIVPTKVPAVTGIQLASAHLGMVQAILAQYLPHARVLAFGSRVTGQPRKYADLDLAIIQPEPLSLRTLARLKGAFEDSDLPICVDLVDWNQCDAEFQAMVTARGMAAV